MMHYDLAAPTDDPDPGRGPGAMEPAASPLIVEESPVFRLAIAGLVAESGDFLPPRFAASLEEALEMQGSTVAGLLLVDLHTIGYDFKGFRQLSHAGYTPAIAVDDRPNAVAAGLARQAGARGYACKSYELEPFKLVVRSVTAGATHFPSELEDLTGTASPRSVEGLSRRQLEVLECIAVGMSNLEIAAALGITIGTVKLHAHAILRLTGARNRTEAALIAQRGLPRPLG